MPPATGRHQALRIGRELDRAPLQRATTTTDLGAMLSQAAAALDPSRRGAVVYIGDGNPTVGELGLLDLQTRLAKLPHPGTS